MDPQHQVHLPLSILVAQLITEKEDILKRWAEHFDSIFLNYKSHDQTIGSPHNLSHKW